MKYLLNIALLFTVFPAWPMSHELLPPPWPMINAFFPAWPTMNKNAFQYPYIEGLLAKGDDINQSRQELYHRTPLECAAEDDDENHNLLVRLLGHGAIIKDYQLEYPASRGLSRNFRILLETAKKRGLHIPTLLNYQNPNDKEAKTPFLYACEHDVFNDLIEDMVAHGAELRPEIPTRETCLHRAVRCRAAKNVATLLPIIEEKFPGTINAQDVDGNTALLRACDYEQQTYSYRLVRLLCSYKASPDIFNRASVTPFDAAIRKLQRLAYCTPQDMRASKEYKGTLANQFRIIKTLLMHNAVPCHSAPWQDSIILTGLRNAYDQAEIEKEYLKKLHQEPTSYMHTLPLDLVQMLKDILHAHISYYDDQQDILVMSKKRKELEM